ncbi:Alpha/beta hydrolase [Novosphingobium sp. Rr 2-17]|uniref:alpha/beta fold hydrolase n=1 Tax=Novosphingobium sp. Rr 2-17 TaxID=555793 RepID=UPI000269ABA9|nr:alpha/beta hydrolase [Novosphingobium sp. Rr 2-17]EIZ77836.1 Alpha/beta hydrolase [Novosphingobium sp. Rr 2-17]
MASHQAPRSLFVDLGETRRHVVEWGAPDAPVLVLQHGIRDHARSWDWVARHLAENYRIIVPDLRGHGDSDWSREGAYSLFDYVIDLHRIATALELSSFDLVGHSLGGHISLRYAGTFPETVRSLTVIEGIELPIVRDQLRNPMPYPERLREWATRQQNVRERNPRFYANIEDAIARMAEQHPRIDADTIDHLTRHGVIVELGKGLRWKYDNACRYRAPDDAHGTDLDDVLDAIRSPVLLAYGDESWIPLPPPERLNGLSRHHLEIFAGASHWLHHEVREQFLAVLGDFLTNTESIPFRKTKHA